MCVGLMSIDGIPTRLNAPVPVLLVLPWPLEEARTRLEAKVGRSRRWETSRRSDRRIDGLVGHDGVVELRVWEADWRRRRKSWNVVFGGRLEPSSEGTTLRGTIGVARADYIRAMMRILRAAAVAPIALAGVTAIAGLLAGSVQFNSVAFGLVVGAASWIGLRFLQEDGERATATDARWLVDRMASLE